MKKNTIWLAVDPDMDEIIFSEKPIRDRDDSWMGGYESWRPAHSGVMIRYVPEGTIELITGIETGDFTWFNEPIEVECNFNIK